MLRLLQMTAYLHVPRIASAASCCSPHKVCRLLYKCDDVETVGRMEWLALELVMEARHVVMERWGKENCALWRMLNDQVKCSRSVRPSLSMVVSLTHAYMHLRRCIQQLLHMSIRNS